MFRLNSSNGSCLNDQYSTFTVKPLHILHLAKSKNGKECSPLFSSQTDTKVTILAPRRQLRKANFSKPTVLHGYSNLLQMCKEDFPVSGVKYDFSWTQKSYSLNGLFGACGLWEILGEKHCPNIDKVFPFIAFFLGYGYCRTLKVFFIQQYIHFTQTP